MRELVARYLSKSISRRRFVHGLVKAGVSAAAVEPIVQSLTQVVQAEAARQVSPESVRLFQGTGGEAFAEQLIASGVRYVFGNSSSGDAHFYDALADRPQLTYILTPHEGPGAAMAAGYVKASRKPAIATQAGSVGLMNAMGQLYNAYKEQTPLVCYSYRRDSSRVASHDAFEEVARQGEIVDPLTKWHWLARRADMIPDTIRRVFKVAWTPPYGPTYASWHWDYLTEQVRTEVIVHEKVDPQMRVRPNSRGVEQAAELLIEAKRPLMIVGDELYKTESIDKAVHFAELLAIPVTQTRSVFANFPHSHPLWVGTAGAGGGVNKLSYPDNPDLVINVGNKLQQGKNPTLIVPRNVKFIDMRIDAASIGNVLTVDVPLVADVAHGLEDLITAVKSIMTPSIKKKVQERGDEVRVFTEQAKKLRALVIRNPAWDNANPMLEERVDYEVGQFADQDAIFINEGGRPHNYGINPLGGRELFSNMGAHLGSGVGTAAGVKLARPDRQVFCLVGDGAFVFGPTALWNMARLELPVIVVVYNNHAYVGPHNRAISAVPGGRMVQTGRIVHDYLGNPDMNMAHIAKGFGVDGEAVDDPDQLKKALARASRATKEGKPYLIDAQVARVGPAWRDKPWTPSLQMTEADRRKA